MLPNAVGSPWKIFGLCAPFFLPLYKWRLHSSLQILQKGHKNIKSEALLLISANLFWFLLPFSQTRVIILLRGIIASYIFGTRCYWVAWLLLSLGSKFLDASGQRDPSASTALTQGVAHHSPFVSWPLTICPDSLPIIVTSWFNL